MTELIPWKSLRGLSPFRREMDDLFERFFGERTSLEPAERSWAPALDIAEAKDAISVNVEVPGMEPKDIDISLSGDTLTIKGEKKQEKEEKNENYYRMERSYGAFSRSVRIPVEVKSEEIKAKYRNGILKITLPKKEEVKPKEIKVETE
jgi:HSP20 family protein